MVSNFRVKDTGMEDSAACFAGGSYVGKPSVHSTK